MKKKPKKVLNEKLKFSALTVWMFSNDNKNDFFFKFPVFRGPPTPKSICNCQTYNRKRKAYLNVDPKMSKYNNQLSENGGFFLYLGCYKIINFFFLEIFRFQGALPPILQLFSRLTPRKTKRT